MTPSKARKLPWQRENGIKAKKTAKSPLTGLELVMTAWVYYLIVM
jgi:hypothetical protein